MVRRLKTWERVERFLRRSLWWAMPLIAAVTVFGAMVSWVLEVPAGHADVVASILVCAWVWLVSFDRRP